MSTSHYGIALRSKVNKTRYITRSDNDHYCRDHFNNKRRVWIGYLRRVYYETAGVHSCYIMYYLGLWNINCSQFHMRHRQCDQWHHMFTKEPQRSNRAGHKMYTGLRQETIFWDIRNLFINSIFFLNKALTLHHESYYWKLKKNIYTLLNKIKGTCWYHDLYWTLSLKEVPGLCQTHCK